MDDFRDKRISVIGAARSGIAAADALTRLGAEVLLSDSQSAQALGVARMAEIEATGARFVTEASTSDALPEGTELVVTSPGVPKDAPVLVEAVRRGIPVWSEIELAFRLTDAPLIATTGTNGKTTTTLLIGAMLQASGKHALVAGNISADEIKRTLVDAAMETRTITDAALENSVLDLLQKVNTILKGKRIDPNRKSIELPILVAEISSFQLEWVERFAPKVAILTNITPDHLNRHSSFEEYAAAKRRVFAAQTPLDVAIINYNDPEARAIGKSGLPGHILWFTHLAAPPDAGPAAWVRDGFLVVRLECGAEPISIMPAQDMPRTLLGAHSIENVLAASAACLVMGANPEAIADAVRHFCGVPHRMEFVAEIDGARYINNSMCTNVAAMIASLSALNAPTIVIAGGVDKGLDFAPLVPVLRAHAKHLLLIGAAADKMEATFRAGGYTAISRADSLEEAVLRAHRMAAPGDCVLLSPGCASFDMFVDFEARGVAFRRATLLLTEHQL